jgi:hypothetical protein
LSGEYLHRRVIKLYGSQVRIIRYIKGKRERNEKEREINRNKEKREGRERKYVDV